MNNGRQPSVMKKTFAGYVRHTVVAVTNLLLALAICHVQAAPPAQTPLFLTVGAKPHIALVMSVDHELYRKAYTDYANLDGQTMTMADTTYRDDFDYYGYFDSDWCYSYTANKNSPKDSYFTPHSKATAPASGVGVNKTHHCVGTAADTWSGNFLNWLAMTRIDIIRRTLFGGKRSVDTTTQTILERAYLPKDVHAYAKVYGGASQDITPFAPTSSFSSGKTYSFCNVSTSNNVTSGYPIIRAAEGNWPLWATVESNFYGGNCQLNPSAVLMPAKVIQDYTAKVEVCKSDKNATVTENGQVSTTPRCRQYGNNYKPIGLLQKHGESGAIKFSLMTGSYKANIKGGVLRKAAKPLVSSPAAATDEINLATGQFNNVPGIIKNISSFRIASFNFASNNALYSDCSSHSISISTFKSGNDAGKRCRDWGNPLSEIYLETLRYIAGTKKPTSSFVVDDSTSDGNYPGIAGLSHESWDDPWPEDQYCAKCSVIVLSTGTNSFDGDDLGGVSDLPGMSLQKLKQFTDSVGTQEYGAFGTGKQFFMGGTDASTRACRAFSLTGLSDYLGVCPELPALEGGYHIAGLAHYARTTDLRPTLDNGPNGRFVQKVNTYAVDLAESIPTFPVKIGNQTVYFVPACESNSNKDSATKNVTTPWSTCSLFDVKVKSLVYSAAGNLVAGSMSFYWEDSLWGFDYDLDVEQQLDFCVGPTAQGCNDNSVGANEIRIKNTIPYAQASNVLRLSYSIYGVSSFKGSWKRNNITTNIPSQGFLGGLVDPWMIRPGGQDYTSLPIPDNVGESTFTFVAGPSSVELPKKPLFLAAKYGGFNDLNDNNALDGVEEWDNYQGQQDGVPDNFFSVKNPALLEESLDAIFTNILRLTSSASAVATSSTRLQEGQYIYQAIFDSTNWSGALRSYKIDEKGAVPSNPTLTTLSTMSTSAVGRKVFTYKSDGAFSKNNADGSVRGTVPFAWTNLDASQRAKLALPADVAGTDQKRVDWLLGNKTHENAATGLRVREYEDANGSKYRNILGDIVNSSPAFVGGYDYRYYALPANLGGGSYSNFLAWKRGAELNGYPSSSAPRIFVGSNGGMLHAFHADTLEEVFAYVPNAIFHKLAKITQPDYGTNANSHQYLVDGPIVTGDAYIATPSDSTKKWRSILVGTFGAGAKGIYALDVTNESQPEVLFEYAHPDMGYILGRPFIAPTAEGRWAIITGNGVDSGTTSKLFVVDLEDPFGKTVILDAGAGSGLSAPALVTDSPGVAKMVYAGDMSGNIWRFSIDLEEPSKWTKYKVFTAVGPASSGTLPQPIVAAPTIGYNAKLGKNMVYVGTGKYHDLIDKSVGGVRHTFYAVPDMGPTGTPATRAKLLQKTFTKNSYDNPSTAIRVVSTQNPNWTTELGWYLDLDYGTDVDERVTTKAVLLQDKLLVTTLIPSDENCFAGGSSWLMQITAVGDMQNNVVIEENLYATELFLGDQNIAMMFPPKAPPSSGSSTSGSSSSAPGNCGDDLDIALINSGTSATGPKAVEGQLKACMVGRQSWRQLK